MSVIHSQPSPFGYLQREKHIEHHTKKPKEEKMCKCMEAQHRQRDGGLRRTGKSVEQPSKKLVLPKKIETSRRGSTRVSCPPSQSAATSHMITPDIEVAMQRTLTVVEELSESVFSELQILAGAQQFCITSNAKPKGKSPFHVSRANLNIYSNIRLVVTANGNIKLFSILDNGICHEHPTPQHHGSSFDQRHHM